MGRQVLVSALPVVWSWRKHGKPNFLALGHLVRDTPYTLIEVGAFRFLITCRVNAESTFAVNEEPFSHFVCFVGRLEKSEYFKNVQTRHTTQRREKDKDVISFEILCPLDVKYRNMDRHGL